MQEELLGLAAAARRLGLSRHTLRAWVRERRLPHVRLGRRVLFDPAELDRFVGANKVWATGVPTRDDAA